MANKDSSAITEFINASTQQPIMGGFDEAVSQQEAELVLRNRVAGSKYAQRQKLPPLPQPRAALPQPRAPHGTPGPTWPTSDPSGLPKPKFRAVGTMPPPLPNARPASRRTRQAAAPPIPVMPKPVVRAPSRLEIPPELDSARHEAPAPAPAPVRKRRAKTSRPRPVAPVEMEDKWFDTPPLDIDLSGFESDDIDIPIDDTRAVPRKSRGAILALAFGGVAIVAAVGVGAYIASSGPGVDKSATASSASVAGAAAGSQGGDEGKASAKSDSVAAQPMADDDVADQWKGAITEADEAVVAPIQPVATPLENEIQFTTEPAGAMVTLIDDGEPVVLGASPAITALEEGHSYEVMVTHPGYATILQPIEIDAASVTISLLADDDAPTIEEALAALPEEESEVATPAAAPSKAPSRDARRKKAAAKKKKASKKVATKASNKAKKKKKAKKTNKKMGTLMIGTKPPCKIFIDGKNTGLMSPQRNISLKPGKHKVTLINKKFGIKKTFNVNVKAGGKTRLIRDWSDKIK